MAFASNVAPKRRPQQPPAGPWQCACVRSEIKLGRRRTVPVEHPGYLVRCPVCRVGRPS